MKLTKTVGFIAGMLSCAILSTAMADSAKPKKCKTTTKIKCTARKANPNVFDCRATATANKGCINKPCVLTFRIHCFLNNVPLTPTPVVLDTVPFTLTGGGGVAISVTDNARVTGGGITYNYVADTSCAGSASSDTATIP